MSIQGPNQPEPKVPLSQLKNMADIDGDGKLRGSELLIFQSVFQPYIKKAVTNRTYKMACGSLCINLY